MCIYVGYVLSDYAHALWISKNKQTVEQAIKEYEKRGGKRPTWIEKYEVTDKLIELDCD